jgi:hypothetical protein
MEIGQSLSHFDSQSALSRSARVPARRQFKRIKRARRSDLLALDPLAAEHVHFFDRNFWPTLLSRLGVLHG